VKIRLILADDQVLVRSGLSAILGLHDDLEVVAEASDGAEAVALTEQHDPDVVVMDIRMPVMDGIEATRRLAGGRARILILTTFDLDEHVYEALKAGASGFLLKDTPPAKLAEAIRTVAAGETLLAPDVTRRVVERYVQTPPRDPEAFAALTDRELEIVRAVARGLSNLEVAAELGLSEATIKTHLTSVLRKLGLRDRTQVVVLAYERGLVVPGA
jgi:DNA-binding NarL/FixJ family response regulator